MVDQNILGNLFIVCFVAFTAFAFAGALAALGDWLFKKKDKDNDII